MGIGVVVSDGLGTTDSPSSTVQAGLGSQDGSGTSDIPTSGLETVYNGSQPCPGCGALMNPLQVLYGYGFCPTCQSRKNAAAVKGGMI
jgi:hypothetical protein